MRLEKEVLLIVLRNIDGHVYMHAKTNVLILLTKINIRQIARYQDYHWSQFVRRFDKNNIFLRSTTG